MNSNPEEFQISYKGTLFEELAKILNLQNIRPGVFVDLDNKEFWLTKYGFISLESYNKDLEILELKTQCSYLKSKVRHYETKKSLNIEKANDIVGKKSRREIRSILSSSLNDSDKLSTISHYIGG